MRFWLVIRESLAFRKRQKGMNTRSLDTHSCEGTTVWQFVVILSFDYHHLEWKNIRFSLLGRINLRTLKINILQHNSDTTSTLVWFIFYTHKPTRIYKYFATYMKVQSWIWENKETVMHFVRYNWTNWKESILLSLRQNGVFVLLQYSIFDLLKRNNFLIIRICNEYNMG